MENSIWLQMLINIGLSTCGLVIFVGWKVRQHLSHFSFNKLWSLNKPYWIWSVSMQTVLAFVLAVSPDSASAIKTMIGLDLSAEPTAFISLGWALAIAAQAAVKKKIDKN